MMTTLPFIVTKDNLKAQIKEQISFLFLMKTYTGVNTQLACKRIYITDLVSVSNDFITILYLHITNNSCC